MITKKCYLCSNNIATTKDHIFPISLFNKPAPSNLPQTLPACEQCNNQLSKDEELFRVFMASGMPYESNAGKRMWNERIRPDLKGRRTGLKPLIRSMVKQARVVTESGNFVGHLGILEMKREPIIRVLSKIAKGLYYLDTQRILPSEIEILVGYYAENPDILSPHFDKAIKGAQRV